MKTGLKRKIIVGAVSLGVLGGVGGAFAASDAGTQLGAWYDTHFTAATTQSATDFGNYAKTAGTTAYNTGMGWLNTAKKNVGDEGTAVTTKSNSAINSYLGDYSKALTDKNASIQSNMDSYFNQFVNTQNGVTDRLITQADTAANAYVNAQMNTAGTNAVNSVNTNVGATKDAAVQGLKKQIADTKAELQSLLNQKQAAATVSLKAHLDAQIQNLEQKYQTLIAQLEVAKKADVDQAGSALVTQAQSDMDAAVDGINQ